MVLGQGRHRAAALALAEVVRRHDRDAVLPCPRFESVPQQRQVAVRRDEDAYKFYASRFISISGALANYVLESIVKRSRTLVFLAHMQDLRSKYEVIFVLKTRFFW